MDEYLTIDTSVKGPIIKDKKSKFLGYAFPVESEETIQLHLESIRKDHPAASHICYAWRLAVDSGVQRVNDDGEPHNSAGKPIMGQIVSLGLHNTLVAVVRYYGGKKLGVGGLIQAYREAAKTCLELVEVKRKEQRILIKVICTYESVDSVIQMSKKNGWKVLSKKFENECTLTLGIRLADEEKIIEILSSLKGVSFSYVSNSM